MALRAGTRVLQWAEARGSPGPAAAPLQQGESVPGGRHSESPSFNPLWMGFIFPAVFLNYLFSFSEKIPIENVFQVKPFLLMSIGEYRSVPGSACLSHV